jgi:hypothetical protein
MWKDRPWFPWSPLTDYERYHIILEILKRRKSNDHTDNRLHKC